MDRVETLQASGTVVKPSCELLTLIGVWIEGYGRRCSLVEYSM